MSAWKKAWAIVIAAMLCSGAQAAIHCEGTVTYALLYSDGTVNILGSWRGDFTHICNTSGTRGSISAEVCLSWYAAASKAAAEGRTLAIYYDTNSYTCANVPVYALALNPVYVGLKRQ